MDPDALEDYRARLEGELAELERTSDRTGADRRPVTLDQQSVGRLSRMDALQNQAMAQGQEARRRARMRAVRAALARFDTGEFGFCMDCGEAIDARRLDLDPTVPRCMDCTSGGG